MIGGLLPLETLSFVLSVHTLEGLHGQQNAHVFLRRMTVAEIFKGFSSSWSFSSNVCQSIDKAGRLRQAPTPLNREISHPSHIDRDKVCNEHEGRAG